MAYFYLSTGTNNFDATSLGASDDRFTALDGDVTAGDSLNGGGGENRFEMIFGGRFDLRLMTSITNIQTFMLDGNAAEFYNLDGVDVYIQANASKDIIHGGSGNETIEYYGNLSEIYAGGGDDTVIIPTTSAIASGVKLDGGTGTNTLKVTATGTINLTTFATFSNFQKINLDAGDQVLVVSQPRLAGVQAIDGGTGNNEIRTATTVLDLSAITLTNIQRISTSNSSGTSFTLANGLTGMTIAGGSGADTFQGLAGQFGASHVLDGGGGTDTFEMVGSGTFDLTAIGSFTAIEQVGTQTSGSTLVVNAAILNDFVAVELRSGGTLKTAATAIDLTGKVVTGVATLEGTSAGTTFTVDNTQLFGGGSDLASISGTGAGNAVSTTGTVLNLGSVTLTNIQMLKTANGSGTEITGTSSAQAIIGGAGADTLRGGGGADKLTGGDGADTFRDTAAHLDGVTITDLTVDDTINLTDVAFAGASASVSGSVLTVKSGMTTMAAITLAPGYSNDFTLASDGAAGLNITFTGTITPPSSGGSGGSDAGVPTFGNTLRPSADGSGLPLVGTRGNDRFTGSSDPSKTDTVMQNGTKFGENTITRNADGSVDIAGPNGRDHLDGIERIVFDDGVLILNLPSVANPITSLYRVMFDRTPDEAGVKWQLGQLQSGANLTKIAGIFLGSDEAGFIKLGNLSNADFIEKLYDNAFDRKADAAGLKYWLDALDHGASRESLALFFVQSPEEVELVGQANKSGVFSAYPEAGHV